MDRERIDRARELRRNMTPAEKRLWYELRNRRFQNAKFRRQVPIGNLTCDFACFEAGLVIEVDGGQHSEDGPRDERRTAWLESEGYRVIRFWNNEVFRNLPGVKQVIEQELSKGLVRVRMEGKRAYPAGLK